MRSSPIFIHGPPRHEFVEDHGHAPGGHERTHKLGYGIDKVLSRTRRSNEPRQGTARRVSSFAPAGAMPNPNPSKPIQHQPHAQARLRPDLLIGIARSCSCSHESFLG
jgi:hypothetical protein